MNSSNTSIVLTPESNLQLRIPNQMGQFHFWTPWLCHNQMDQLRTTVFRKPTHTDMYLHWDSYHHLSAKYSVINTLRHRAKTVCSTQQLLKEEEDHLHNSLRRCKYPYGAWNRTNIKKKPKKNNPREQKHQQVLHCGAIYERSR